jgi:hypothetical protein
MDVVISSQFTSNFHHTVAFPEVDDVDILYEQKWQNNTFPSFVRTENEKKNKCGFTVDVGLNNTILLNTPVFPKLFYLWAPFGFQKQWQILTSLLTLSVRMIGTQY